jgi:hypothetical protein
MDFALLTGDQAMYATSFPPATVIASPGILSGSGQATVGGVTVCVAGDEASAMVPSAAYFTASFPIPGTGMLRITSLGSDQTAQKATSGGRAVLLAGSRFEAELQVLAPATNPSGVPDPVTQYSGSGSFMTTNTKARAG